MSPSSRLHPLTDHTQVKSLGDHCNYNQWIHFIKSEMKERVFQILNGLYDLLLHNVSNYVEKLTKGVEEMPGAATVRSAVRYLQGALLRSGKQEELLREHLEVTEEEVVIHSSAVAPSPELKRENVEERKVLCLCGECQREILEGEKYVKNAHRTNTPRCHTCYQRPYRALMYQRRKAQMEKQRLRRRARWRTAR
ncbi:hypothetical protein PROFUN_07947 [Planoprotostelium fungivorum]|uniref:Uncharacterized protein n=1 Tax=Planoprotostelium fungivorum TaxID=1890364 RepID=A0A2P6NL65_9EUKA|nr:hypothetical protein PROFUN_07947 [Planoprotostelium fungivorum]